EPHHDHTALPFFLRRLVRIGHQLRQGLERTVLQQLALDDPTAGLHVHLLARVGPIARAPDQLGAEALKLLPRGVGHQQPSSSEGCPFSYMVNARMRKPTPVDTPFTATRAQPGGANGTAT